MTNLQLELLKIYSFDISDKQLEDIKGLLANYFAEQVSSEMDDLFESNNWGEEKIKEWSEEHMRTKYDNQ